MIPDLKTLYKTLHWHNAERDKPPGKSVGLFITLPSDLAGKFPDKEGEDNSPPHITLNYIGDFEQQLEPKLVDVVRGICSKFKPFKVKLKKQKRFKNDEGQDIYHSPVSSRQLKKLNAMLKNKLQLHQIPVDTKYATYKPHSTVEYVDEGAKRKHKEVDPTGEFVVEHIWIWGTSEPYMIKLGK